MRNKDNKSKRFAGFLIVIVLAFVAACSKSVPQNSANSTNANAPAQAAPGPTPSNSITAEDIAKLKWLEGTWRGMDGEKPFFERYRFDGTTMIVETLDESLKKVEDTSRFTLVDGEFGHAEGDKRSLASSITADAVQFVPSPAGSGNAFRFERAGAGWRAVLEWVDKEGKPQQKIYAMEKWPK